MVTFEEMDKLFSIIFKQIEGYKKKPHNLTQSEILDFVIKLEWFLNQLKMEFFKCTNQ